MPRSLKVLAQEAISAQSACNPLGVVRSYSDALVDLRSHVSGTTEICVHPITRLWACKVADLCQMSYDSVAFSEAHAACQKLAEG